MDVTGRQYLGRLRVLKAQIQKDMENVSYWQHKAYGVRAIEYKQDVIQVSVSNDATTHAIERYLHYEKKLADDVSEYEQAKKEIKQVLSSLESKRHARLLYLHYVAGYSLIDIQTIMKKPNGSKYTYQRIRVLHGEGLKSVAEKLEKQQ